MDRLSKKCVIASGVVHGTLVLLLIVGPAFVSSTETSLKPNEIIDFIPFKTIDQNLTGGGNPNVAQVIPPAQLTPPQPQARPEPPPPKPERLPDPEPPKPKAPDVVKPVERDTPKPDPDSLETKPKRNAPKVNLNLTARQPTKPQASNTAAENRNRERTTREREKSFETALNNIRGNASDPVKLSDLRGPGGGGIPYAGFNQALISAYMRAWLIPSEAAGENKTVVATITLSRDGSVISARVSKGSGNSDLDKSVQRALDKVTFVAPFPDSIKEGQKTFWLEFDPKAKRLMG